MTMKPTNAITQNKNLLADQVRAATAGPNPWGYRYTGQFKTVNGRLYQLHSTRGWKCIGKAHIKSHVKYDPVTGQKYVRYTLESEMISS